MEIYMVLLLVTKHYSKEMVQSYGSSHRRWRGPEYACGDTGPGGT